MVTIRGIYTELKPAPAGILVATKLIIRTEIPGGGADGGS